MQGAVIAECSDCIVLSPLPAGYREERRSERKVQGVGRMGGRWGGSRVRRAGGGHRGGGRKRCSRVRGRRCDQL